MRLVKGRNAVLFSGFCGFLIVLFTVSLSYEQNCGGKTLKLQMKIS